MYENKETFLSAFKSCRAKTKPTYEQINYFFFFTFGYPFACDRGALKPTHSNWILNLKHARDERHILSLLHPEFTDLK